MISSQCSRIYLWPCVNLRRLKRLRRLASLLSAGCILPQHISCLRTTGETLTRLQLLDFLVARPQRLSWHTVLFLLWRLLVALSTHLPRIMLIARWLYRCSGSIVNVLCYRSLWCGKLQWTHLWQQAVEAASTRPDKTYVFDCVVYWLHFLGCTLSGEYP